MDDKKLIERVRAHEELYNMDHKKYCDTAHKNGVWLAIGKELNVTGAACKCRWISLRDQLRKVLKRKSETGYTRRWRHEDSMAFIIPFFKDKEPRTNKVLAENAGEESNGEDDVPENVEENDPDTSSRLPKIEVTWAEPSPKVIPAPIAYSPKNSIEPDMVLMDYLGESRRLSGEPTTSPTTAHVIDLFFNGIAATVKTFPPEYQHMAKSRVFAAVSDLEWSHLEGRKPSYYGKGHSVVTLPSSQTTGHNSSSQGMTTTVMDEITLYSAL